MRDRVVDIPTEDPFEFRGRKLRWDSEGRLREWHKYRNQWVLVQEPGFEIAVRREFDWGRTRRGKLVRDSVGIAIFALPLHLFLAWAVHQVKDGSAPAVFLISFVATAITYYAALSVRS